MERERLYGGEIEKPISGLVDCTPHRVGEKFFSSLKQQAENRGTFVKLDEVNKVSIGVESSDLGEQGLDNGFNLQETSLPPYSSLKELYVNQLLDLHTIRNALETEGATVINLSIHPLGKRNMETYRAFVAPKGIYPYLWYRGWDHTAGIDARAQNSPTTSVTPEEAATAVSVIIGAGAAFIGLFANSPFEEGKESPYKEARLTMWERMMRHSKIEGDRITAQFPPYRFETLSQYFNWMFGPGTAIHFVIQSQEGTEYKNVGDRILIIPNNPTVIEYLSQPSWDAVRLTDIFNNFPPTPFKIKPHISHFEAMQFAQFTGARIRFTLSSYDIDLHDFLEALNNPKSDNLERIFSQYIKSMWIEGRDPGANFPDREMMDKNPQAAQYVIIAPSAIQAGLIRNLEEASRFIDKFPWDQLKALREEAIKNGLSGEVNNLTVKDFASRVLEIAARGLTSEEGRFLSYPRWVLETNANGADRAIRFVEKSEKPIAEALKDLVRSRQVIL